MGKIKKIDLDTLVKSIQRRLQEEKDCIFRERTSEEAYEELVLENLEYIIESILWTDTTAYDSYWVDIFGVEDYIENYNVDKEYKDCKAEIAYCIRDMLSESDNEILKKYYYDVNIGVFEKIGVQWEKKKRK